jgi:type 1 glutamine amidotransferase
MCASSGLGRVPRLPLRPTDASPAHHVPWSTREPVCRTFVHRPPTVPGANYADRTRKLALLVVVLIAAAFAASTAPAAKPRVLVFSKTAGFRHDSIPAAIEAVRTLGARNGFDVDATEDEAVFTKARLARYGAVVFLLTTGDVLDDAEQAAFQAYFRSGGGFVGVHSAADTERDWPWYGRLVGAWSSGHPEIQAATIDVVSPRDTSTMHLPVRWARTDEWYGFLSNPRRNGVRVLLTLDESTYQPRSWAMGTDHPIAWKHEFDGGRAWYTQGGHTVESYAEPLFVRHLLGGISYALGRTSPPLAPTIRSVSLAVRGGRVVVSLRATRCARCTAVLRVRSKTVPLRMAGNTAKGSSATLPKGRWQVAIVLTDGDSGLSRTARRWIRID